MQTKNKSQHVLLSPLNNQNQIIHTNRHSISEICNLWCFLQRKIVLLKWKKKQKTTHSDILKVRIQLKWHRYLRLFPKATKWNSTIFRIFFESIIFLNNKRANKTVGRQPAHDTNKYNNDICQAQFFSFSLNYFLIRYFPKFNSLWHLIF